MKWITKGKRRKGFKYQSKTRQHRSKVLRKGTGSFFLTKKDMAAMKWDEAVAHSIAKTNGKKLVGVRQCQCSCGAEGCCYTTPLEDSGAMLPKQSKKPTKHPKRREHPMFRGKIVE